MFGYFFKQPYPAIRSRKIFISLLEQAGIFSVFDKNSSFDRLFPNQDFLSGKGFGNLIALPLFKKTIEKGNSCFIDVETLQPIEDQWGFLENIQRVSTTQLDEVYESISNSTLQNSPHTPSSNGFGKLVISLSNHVRMSRNNIPYLILKMKDEN